MPFFALVMCIVRTTVISTQIAHKLDSDILSKALFNEGSKKSFRLYSPISFDLNIFKRYQYSIFVSSGRTLIILQILPSLCYVSYMIPIRKKTTKECIYLRSRCKRATKITHPYVLHMCFRLKYEEKNTQQKFRLVF